MNTGIVDYKPLNEELVSLNHKFYLDYNNLFSTRFLILVMM